MGYCCQRYKSGRRIKTYRKNYKRFSRFCDWVDVSNNLIVSDTELHLQNCSMAEEFYIIF
jgi:hypothetical protein